MSGTHAWDVPTMDRSVCKIPTDENLFRDLASVLKRHGALDRFGITLLHKHFEIGPDEVLLETTDEAGRQQFFRVVRRADVAGLGAVETAWKLGPNGEALWGCVCVTNRNGDHIGHRPTR
jgi:hypothetical protein